MTNISIYVALDIFWEEKKLKLWLSRGFISGFAHAYADSIAFGRKKEEGIYSSSNKIILCAWGDKFIIKHAWKMEWTIHGPQELNLRLSCIFPDSIKVNAVHAWDFCIWPTVATINLIKSLMERLIASWCCWIICQLCIWGWSHAAVATMGSDQGVPLIKPLMEWDVDCWLVRCWWIVCELCIWKFADGPMLLFLIDGWTRRKKLN